MNPFEDLIRELSLVLDVPLRADSHQSCLIQFPQYQVSVQIDLDTNADQILVGSQLGNLTPGTYRFEVLKQAMRVNGLSIARRGSLAYSQKNDSLVLFQFLPLANLNAEKLYKFLQLFLEHAKIWKDALERSEIPIIEDGR